MQPIQSKTIRRVTRQIRYTAITAAVLCHPITSAKPRSFTHIPPLHSWSLQGLLPLTLPSAMLQVAIFSSPGDGKSPVPNSQEAAQFHCIHLIRVLVKLLPSWLPDSLFAVLQQRWNSQQRVNRSASAECTTCTCFGIFIWQRTCLRLMLMETFKLQFCCYNMSPSSNPAYLLPDLPACTVGFLAMTLCHTLAGQHNQSILSCWKPVILMPCCCWSRPAVSDCMDQSPGWLDIHAHKHNPAMANFVSPVCCLHSTHNSGGAELPRRKGCKGISCWKPAALPSAT